MKALIKAAFLALAAPAVMCSAQAAGQQDLAAVLSKRYVDQPLFLRRSVEKSKQVYDSTGTLLDKGKDGPWTLYAGVKPKTISLSSEEMRIEGVRLVFAFDAGIQALAPITTKGRIEVTIHLGRPVTTIEEAEVVFGKVFAMTDEDVVQSVPEIWKAYARKRVRQKSIPEAQTVGAEADAHAEQDTHQPGFDKALTPPRPIYTPEPGFYSFAAEYARGREFQAVAVFDALIDKTGRVLNPRIKSPAGMGLDERAIEVMKSWRFQPAKRNGQPVEMQMVLEIQFNLN